MGPLSRLRAWLGELFGGTDGDDPETDERSTAEESAGEGDSDSDAGDRLDPSAAAETRAAATDDAVNALRDVRQNGPAQGVDGGENADAENVDSKSGEAESADAEN